ncbi:hypothetical protein BDN72DRAFT_896882, partial [Pluteus cervinus]
MARFGYLLAMTLAACAYQTQAVPVARNNNNSNNECSTASAKTVSGIASVNQALLPLLTFSRGNSEAEDLVNLIVSSLSGARNGVQVISSSIGRGGVVSEDSLAAVLGLGNAWQALDGLQSRNGQISNDIGNARSKLKKTIKNCQSMMGVCLGSEKSNDNKIKMQKSTKTVEMGNDNKNKSSAAANAKTATKAANKSKNTAAVSTGDIKVAGKAKNGDAATVTVTETVTVTVDKAGATGAASKASSAKNGAVKDDQSKGAATKDQSKGAATKDQSKGAATKDQSKGAATKDQTSAAGKASS